MKRITDQNRIRAWLEESGVQDQFDSAGLQFQGVCYEKGEYLTAPGRRLDWLLFLVKGSVRIYGIHENGSLLPVDQLESPAMVGDLEFMEEGYSSFYAEANTPVTCLALPVPVYRGQLDRDVRFLHTLLRAYAAKLRIFSAMDITAPTIEERVLLYMETACPGGELRGIETAVLQLRCSRRQLQRVLRKLCEEGRVQKIGKGRYRLTGETAGAEPLDLTEPVR